MRDLIVFLIVLGVVFFAVGEWRGWYLGVPSQTPVFVYKRDAVGNASRRVFNLEGLPLEITGRVRAGELTVKVFYQRPGSFQSGQQGGAEREVFERTYLRGQRVALDEFIDRGAGQYRVELTFEDATGLFRIGVPAGAEL